MLHSLRKRLQELAEREAAGESFWSPSFPQPVRTRMTYVFQQILSGSWFKPIHLFGESRRLIASQIGAYTLAGSNLPDDDFFAYYQTCPDEMFPTVLEALARTFHLLDEQRTRFIGRATPDSSWRVSTKSLLKSVSAGSSRTG